MEMSTKDSAHLKVDKKNNKTIGNQTATPQTADFHNTNSKGNS